MLLTMGQFAVIVKGPAGSDSSAKSHFRTKKVICK